MPVDGVLRANADDMKIINGWHRVIASIASADDTERSPIIMDQFHSGPSERTGAPDVTLHWYFVGSSQEFDDFFHGDYGPRGEKNKNNWLRMHGIDRSQPLGHE